MNKHLQDLLTRCPALEPIAADINAAFELLQTCHRSGGKLLLCGNGGSAADADHWAGELLKGFALKRPLSTDEKRDLPEVLGTKLQRAIAAIPLGGFTALSTAFANDVDPCYTYAQLVFALGKPGDVLIGISTSGNAMNVRLAMQTARARGLRCLGLTGADGGALRSLSDICLRAPATETFRTQEYHLPIYHTLCLMLEETFFA